MAGPVHCRCGAVLVDEATDSGVKPIGSDEAIVFRRKTDYVVCPECFAVYSARSILAGAPEEELDVERLERLIEQQPPAE